MFIIKVILVFKLNVFMISVLSMLSLTSNISNQWFLSADDPRCGVFRSTVLEQG